MSDVTLAFLEKAGWQDAARVSLAGDASSRRYNRLTKPDGRVAILMMAGRDGAASTHQFIQVAEHLTSGGFSAPQIFAQDADEGLLLLEDLGTTDFAQKIANDPTCETELYQAAIDTLLAMRTLPPLEGLSTLSGETLVDMTRIAFDVYAECDLPQATENSLSKAFRQISETAPVLALRDFHAENLIWMPDRTGPKSVGLLDFQDAVLAHPAYDLMSLVQDIRRDVSADLKPVLIAKFANALGVDQTTFAFEASLVSAQRNLRILGVFANLCLTHGKAGYVDLLPRVWQRLNEDLAHSELASLKKELLEILPEPTPDFLKAMKSKCPTD